MKPLFVSLVCVMLSIFTLSAQTETQITLHTQTGNLEASLLTPDNDSKQMVALIICGSGPTDRDGNNPQMQNNSIKYLAQDLARAGIASLRYDKRGIAKSAAAGPKESDLRFSNYVNDAKEWVEILSREYKQVVVIGHSEGSMVGIMVAVNNPKVAKLVSIAGPGRAADAILKSQLSQQPQVVTDVAFPIIESLKKGIQVDQIPAGFEALFRQSVQPYMISWFAIDPAAEIAKISAPTLIIQGDKDIQISVADAEMLAAAQPKAQKTIIANMNHVFKLSVTMDMVAQIATYANPELKNVPQLSDAIVAFIND